MRPEQTRFDVVPASRMSRWILTLACMLVLGACQPGGRESSLVDGNLAAPSQVTEAQETLTDFFDSLQSGQYSEAAGIYGGSYESLIGWNPATDPKNQAELLRNGCTFNGLNCLRTRSVNLVDQPAPGEYVFLVEFESPDGGIFVLGPCCGADETEQPPVSKFPIRVIHNEEGDFLVMDLPPYSP